MDQQEPQQLRDADWVAGRLNITRYRTYALTRMGIIPAVRLGRLVRYDPGAIDQLIESGGKGLDESDSATVDQSEHAS